MRPNTPVRFICFFILAIYLTFIGNLPFAFADEAAKKGDKVSIEYEGSLDGGTVIDSSKNHDKPLQFVIGSGQVIPGFDKAVLGMKINEEKKSGLNRLKLMARQTKN